MAGALSVGEKTVRCEDCGARFDRVAWSPGDCCPKCGSAAFAPVPVRGEASDYSSADRSAAFALEDIRFGRLAQWAGLITPKQFQYALHQQKQIAAAGREVPDLGSLFIRDKVMDRRQVDAVLAVRCARPGNTEDADFAAAAMRLGQVKELQVAECRRMQDQAAASGHDPAPLPLMFYEKRCMQENQVLALLLNLDRQSTGLLPRLRRLAAPPKAKPLKEQVLGEPHTVGRWARVGAFGIIAVIVLYSSVTFVSGLTGNVKVRCEKCLGEFFAPENSSWPVKCPNCEAKDAFPLGLCQNCGEIFPIHGGVGYGVSVACPKCGKSIYKFITPDMDKNMLALQAEIRSHRTGPDRGD